MEVCYWALLFMPLVILHHLLNVFVQLANKRGFKQKKTYNQSGVEPTRVCPSTVVSHWLVFSWTDTADVVVAYFTMLSVS
jgi:hypothetical protein